MKNYLKEVKITLDKKEEGPEVFKVTSPASAVIPLKKLIGDSIDVYETAIAVFLDSSNNSIGWFKISQGGINYSVVDIRLLFSAALNCLAVSMIFCHNHPSGSLKPSSADIDITNKISSASDILNIKLLDHIIVAETGYYSFREEGLL